MSSRKPGYLLGVFFLALITSLPQLAIIGFVLFGMYWSSGQLILPGFPGLVKGNVSGNQYAALDLFRGNFVHFPDSISSEEIASFTVKLIDPSTGGKSDWRPKTAKFGPKRGIRTRYQVVQFGDRLFLTGRGGSYEFIGDELKPCPSAVPPPPLPPRRSERFNWNGEPAIVQPSLKATGHKVVVGRDGKWTPVGDIAIPTVQVYRSNGDVPAEVLRAFAVGKSSKVTVLQSNEDAHVFLLNDGLLSHHQGLELNGQITSDPDLSSGQIVRAKYEHFDPSRPTAGNVNPWTIVSKESVTATNRSDCAYGLLIEGKPKAIIISDLSSPQSKAIFYELDSNQWTETYRAELPFATRNVRVVTAADGVASYLIATTANQVVHFFSIETQGLRKLHGMDRDIDLSLFEIWFYGCIIAATTVLGIVLGLCCWLLMWRYTKPGFETGIDSVKLASLGWRGFARLIDISIVLATVTGLGWLLTLGFDWSTFFEAIKMNVDHPTLRTGMRIGTLLLMSAIAIVGAMICSQAYWGVTPGKWICRLKTVRTTLRPVGFARSLAREIVMFVDCGNGFCWAPGILSIALTGQRQRLGDLVADTIVIEV